MQTSELDSHIAEYSSLARTCDLYKRTSDAAVRLQCRFLGSDPSNTTKRDFHHGLLAHTHVLQGWMPIV